MSKVMDATWSMGPQKLASLNEEIEHAKGRIDYYENRYPKDGVLTYPERSKAAWYWRNEWKKLQKKRDAYLIPERKTA